MAKRSFARYIPPMPDLTPIEDQTPGPEHVWFSPFYQAAQHIQRLRSGNTQGPGMTGGEVSDHPDSRSQ